jgi:hypothetical protein
MKRALEAFGRNVAKTYLGLLLCIVYVFPVIFVGAFIALLAYVFDHIGLGRLIGITELILFVVISFAAALFFSAYVWPLVSAAIGNVMDELGEASKS